jgi:hypothetical protein
MIRCVDRQQTSKLSKHKLIDRWHAVPIRHRGKVFVLGVVDVITLLVFLLERARHHPPMLTLSAAIESGLVVPVR